MLQRTIARPRALHRIGVARKIRRIAFDRLRGHHKWHHGVYALDVSTGIAIVFARGMGADILELRVPARGSVQARTSDLMALTRGVTHVSALVWDLADLGRTSSTMELREYSYPTDAVGKLISGPPVS